MRAIDHAPRAQKNPPTFIRRRTVRGEFLFERSLSRTSTLLGQGTLPSPTAGSRIRFPESLLMLETLYKRAEAVCQLPTTGFLAVGEYQGSGQKHSARLASLPGDRNGRYGKRLMADSGCSFIPQFDSLSKSDY
jgi:hypothetical protein